jgi:PAS domain S-box-containing protein
LGYSTEELKSLSPLGVAGLIYDEDKAVFFSRLENHIHGEPSHASLEFRAVRKNGSIVWLEAFASRIEYMGQAAVQGMFLDIDERKKAQEIVKKSEEEYSALFENMIDGFSYCKMMFNEKGKPNDFVYLQVNDAFERITGLKRDAIIGKKATEAIHGIIEANPELFEIYERVVFTGKKEKFELFFKSLNFWLNISVYSPAKGHFAAVFEDITERKKAEKALIESESRYRLLADNTRDVIWTTDLEGHCTYISPSVLQLRGYSVEEAMKQSMLEALTPSSAQLMLEGMRRFQETGEIASNCFELENTCKDGSTVWVEANLTILRNSNGEPESILGVNRNITERKKTERALSDSEEKFRGLFECAGDYIFVLRFPPNELPIIVDANSAALRIHGYSKDELIGKPISIVDKQIDVETIKKILEQLTQDKPFIFEAKHQRKDGSVFDVEVSARTMKIGMDTFVVTLERDISKRKKTEEALRQERDMLESLTGNIGAGLVMISKDYKILWMNNYLKQLTGASENNPCYSSFNTCTSICPDCGAKKVFEGASIDRREYCNQTEFNKDHPVWFELIATPIKDKDGNVVAALELTVNITEKKEAEKKQSESSDRIKMMNEKLRVVGSLSRHDVGNKLSAVNGYTYLMKKRYKDQSDIVEGLGKIEQAVADSVKIFEFSNMFEQLGAKELTCIDMGKALDEAASLFTGLKFKIVNEVHDVRVLADSFLRQMFYNFIDNTRKYGEKATTVKVYCEETDSGGLRLIYEDDGVGISAENKSKLFTEGFSTGGSTGFGLFFIKKMMSVYGWTITEEGETGKGAKIVISISMPSVYSFGKSNLDSK